MLGGIFLRGAQDLGVGGVAEGFAGRAEADAIDVGLGEAVDELSGEAGVRRVMSVEVNRHNSGPEYQSNAFDFFNQKKKAAREATGKRPAAMKMGR